MEFDDIFDEMRKMMKNPFKGFFDLDDFEPVMEEDQAIKEKRPKKKDNNTKSYSISYKYGTGMKEPEIKVEGDVDEKTLNDFLGSVKNSLGELPFLESTPNLLEEIRPSKDSDSESGVIEPFTDIQNHEKGATLTLEMPGIGQEDVKVDIDKDKVIISANHGNLNYRKQAQLGFKPKNAPHITAINGIITLEFEHA